MFSGIFSWLRHFLCKVDLLVRSDQVYYPHTMRRVLRNVSRLCFTTIKKHSCSDSKKPFSSFRCDQVYYSHIIRRYPATLLVCASQRSAIILTSIKLGSLLFVLLFFNFRGTLDSIQVIHASISSTKTGLTITLSLILEANAYTTWSWPSSRVTMSKPRGVSFSSLPFIV